MRLYFKPGASSWLIFTSSEAHLARLIDDLERGLPDGRYTLGKRFALARIAGRASVREVLRFGGLLIDEAVA